MLSHPKLSEVFMITQTITVTVKVPANQNNAKRIKILLVVDQRVTIKNLVEIILRILSDDKQK